MDFRYWNHAGRSLVRNMRSASFARELATAGLRADAEAGLERLSLWDVFPGLAGIGVDLGTVTVTSSSLSPLEQYTIAGLARLRRPRRVFEFGTYEGATSLLLARNAPLAEVFTLDLPVDQSQLTPHVAETANISSGRVGHCFHDQPEASRITQLLGDSRTFDFSPYRGLIDLVLVDGGHEYENVKADTRTALSMITPGGIVIWDDFAVGYPGVVTAVGESGVPAFKVAHTDLAVYDSAR